MLILDQMNNNFAKINNSNDELKQLIENKCSNETINNASAVSAIENNLSTLHVKIDQHLTSCKTSEARNSSLIIEKLNALNESIHHPPTHTNKFLSRNKNDIKRVADPLNWSFSFNQSVLPNDNVELYQLLHGFEQNTWTSFDYLRQKLNENTDTVSHIESICNEISSSHTQHRLDSPVTNSIQLDTLQLIQDKCDTIGDKMQALETTMRALSSVDYRSTDLSTSDFPSQQLRERLRKIVSSEVNVNLNEQRPVATPTSANASMNYSIIDELLAVPHPERHTWNSLNDKEKTTAAVPDPCTTNAILEAASPTTDRLWFHVSNLKLGTSEEMVKKFILQNKKFSQMDFVVKSLIKRDHCPSNITFASFKVGFEPSSAIDFTELKSIWPTNVSFGKFIPKNLHHRRHRM